MQMEQLTRDNESVRKKELAGIQIKLVRHGEYEWNQLRRLIINVFLI